MVCNFQPTTPQHTRWCIFCLYSMECLRLLTRPGYYVATMQILIQDASSDNLLMSGQSPVTAGVCAVTSRDPSLLLKITREVKRKHWLRVRIILEINNQQICPELSHWQTEGMSILSRWLSQSLSRCSLGHITSKVNWSSCYTVTAAVS